MRDLRAIFLVGQQCSLPLSLQHSVHVSCPLFISELLVGLPATAVLPTLPQSLWQEWTKLGCKCKASYVIPIVMVNLGGLRTLPPVMCTLALRLVGFHGP